MRKLDKPNFKVREVVTESIETYRNDDLKSRFIESIGALEELEDIYDSKGDLQELCTIQADDRLLRVSSHEMVELYEKKFVSFKEGTYYHTLRTSASICPFCGERDSKTLEHYLPKAIYSAYSVTPYNLIPCCSCCNAAKHAKIYSQRGEQTLHPYYDDPNVCRWLRAEVIEKQPIAFKYYVDENASLDQLFIRRIKSHFDCFGLQVLYATKAATRIASWRSLIINRLGIAGIREWLSNNSYSFLEDNCNSWEGVMYEALLNSEWFCNGEGFEVLRRQGNQT